MFFSMGFVLALGAGLFESLVDVARKASVRTCNAWTAAWGARVVAVGLLVPLAIIQRPQMFPTNGTFWMAVSGTSVLNAVASVLYMRALQQSPMSLVLPIVTLSPVLILVTGPLINHEVPSLLGVIGVIFTSIGTYALNGHLVREGLLAPVRSLWREKGMRTMLAVACLWGISAPLDKRAISVSDPLWFFAIASVLIACILMPFVLRYGSIRTFGSMAGIRALAPIGIASVCGGLCQFQALTTMIVPYVIGLKRTSVLWGVLFGKLIYREERIGTRFLASCLMVIGSVLILLAQLR